MAPIGAKLSNGLAVARNGRGGDVAPPFQLPGRSTSLGKEDAAMSRSPQQPPLQPGDLVRYVFDPDHVETVESCELIDGVAVPHWQVVTTWDGNRRVADASEFTFEFDQGASS